MTTALPEGRMAYSVSEIQGFLGVSKTLVHEMLRRGQLGSVKAGRRTLITQAHLDRFLEGE